MGAQLPLIAEDGKLESLAIMQAFYEYLAPKPYCTDMLGFLLIRPKSIAIRNAYIQPNPITRAYWLVFDIDSEWSRYWPDEWDTPTPNIEIRNPENNHQHLFYMADFTVPMLAQEVQCIVRSVSKWTARHMTPEGMRAWGEPGRRKSIMTRQKKAEERDAEIRTYYAGHPDVTREELARIFDVEETVIKGLSLGLTKSRQEARQSQAAKRAGEIRVYKAEHPSLSNRAIAMVFL